MIVGVEEDLNVSLVAVEKLPKGELRVGGPDLEGVAQLLPDQLPAKVGVAGRRPPQRPGQVGVGPSLSWSRNTTNFINPKFIIIDEKAKKRI